MSLPNYLASIKSSGFYRFVWDKSTIPSPQATTMRLLIGYSEKGPFNTPVYIDNQSDFINTFGNISKRMERKGIFFHRMALQALSSGPILALNLKPFNTESISYINFDGNSLGTGGSITKGTKTVKTVYDTNRFWSLDPDQLPKKIDSGAGDKYMYLSSTDSTETSCSVFIRKSKDINNSYKDITIKQWYQSTGDEMPLYLDPIQEEKISDYFIDVYVFKGEFSPKICSTVLKPYFDILDEGGEVMEEVDTSSLTGDEKVRLKETYTNSFNKQVDVFDALAADENSNFLYKYQGVTIPNFKDAMGYYISIDVLLNKDNYSHKLLMKLDDAKLDDLTVAADINNKIKCGEDDANREPIYLPGYIYTALDSVKTNYPEMVDTILGVIDTEEGIREALTNNVDIEYHYIVDTFNSYPSMPTAKSRLFLIAKEKDNAFALVNFPAIPEFASDPTFQTAGKFDMEKVSKLYTLPSEAEGASWGAYFTQVVFSDGTVKNYVPSAALVSNNFMAKWNGRQPYYVVAGPTYGVINYSGMTSPDYNYSRADLDILEPMGINAIIYVPRKGIFINSNQTAKQKPVSSLSKINVRELVIYLQNEIEYMLQNYQWELNTQTLRDTIKSKADYLLENIMSNGGIYAYKSVCDETNNTPEVIDNEMVVIDIEIEAGKACGKMVQTLTIHKTGGISSQG